ncbi:MAG: thiamine pyrophosphate-dependent dehydrogenase E1 component subunit alpha [SAR202 cluster bacterium]|nr:thiamine pyrophosphate-dependent dehydrogenase E1 component subunit alpha [SAR202 cluster bacterium]
MPKDLREMYRLMLMSRIYTDRALQLFDEGRLPTGLHPSAGQEAIGVGACYGLRREDWVIPSLRTTECFWTRGVTMQQMMDAMYGNKDSVNRGKESFHHSGYPSLGILAGTAIVAAHIPVAVGAAKAMQLKGTDNVMLCFFGDGAAARGDFHEGLNLAAVHKAPVVFICENNLHFQTAPASVEMAITDIADRAAGYGFPGVIVDGQDVLAVHETTQEAIKRARQGKGPTLIEAKTYRFRRHYPILAETRPVEEIAEWSKRDPVTILGDYLLANGHMNVSEKQELETSIIIELDSVVARAEAKQAADKSAANSTVYAEGAS